MVFFINSDKLNQLDRKIRENFIHKNGIKSLITMLLDVLGSCWDKWFFVIFPDNGTKLRRSGNP
jgi:hypothetical protein